MSPYVLFWVTDKFNVDSGMVESNENSADILVHILGLIDVDGVTVTGEQR